VKPIDKNKDAVFLQGQNQERLRSWRFP